MTSRIPLSLVIALGLVLFSPLRGLAAEADATSLQSSAEKLYASLTDAQRKQATLPFESP